MLEPQLENNGALSHALAPIYNVYIYIYIYIQFMKLNAKIGLKFW